MTAYLYHRKETHVLTAITTTTLVAGEVRLQVGAAYEVRISRTRGGGLELQILRSGSPEKVSTQLSEAQSEELLADIGAVLDGVSHG